MALLLDNAPDELRAEANETLPLLENRIAETGDPLLQSAAAMLVAALATGGDSPAP
jgi:hypothetical protein